MEHSEKRSNLAALTRKYYRQILFILSVFIILLGMERMWSHPLDLHEGQSSSWWEIAQNIQSGKGYKSCDISYVPNCQLTNQETALREPLPTYLFAWIGSQTNNSTIVFESVQILANLLILFGVFKLARELYTIEAAVVAAMTWAAYLPSIQLESTLTGDLLACLFVSFGFIQFIQIIKFNKLKDWLSFGLLFGLSVISRFAILALVFGLGCGYLLYLYMTLLQEAVL